MRELRLVAVSDDGSRLLLRGDAQEPEFSVHIDERLHAALRGDRARLGQLEIQMDSQLRPRDIQARVRAGESVSQVATAAGVPAERVMRYAGPVLAERQHIADRARRCAVRRQGADGPAPLLEDTVTSRLDAKGVDTQTLEWDAWRRDDGRWLVVTSWQVAGKPRAARWVFDPAGRSVSPTDDEAKWLSGELPPAEAPPAPARLAVVPSLDVPEFVATSTDVADTDAKASAAGSEAGAGHVDSSPTVPVDVGSARLTAGADAADADVPVPARSRRPAAAAVDAETTDHGRLRLSDIARHIEVDGEPADSESADAAASQTGTEHHARPVAAGRKARASVPTWDEIMFGRRRRSD